MPKQSLPQEDACTQVFHENITCPGAVNLMETGGGGGSTPMCHNVPQPMNNVGGVPSSAPTHPLKKADTPWGGGGTCTFPKIGGKPDKPTHPSSVPPPVTVSTSH